MRMALVANSPSVQDQQIVTNLFGSNEAIWWHWFPTAWLINDPHHRDPLFWTQLLRATVPNLVFMLISLDDPQRPPIGYMKPEWYDWIRLNWPE